MGTFANRSADHLRFAKFYLIAIGSVALLLLVLFTVSLERQRETAKSISVTNLRLDGERLAVEVERRTWELAEDALRDTEIRGLAMNLAAESDPGEVLKVRARLKEVAKRHPIAEHFFVILDGKVRYPQLKSPGTRLQIPNVIAGSSPRERQFAALFLEGEREAGQGRNERAIPYYLQSSELPVPDSLKALALSRLAAGYKAAKRPTDAARIYGQLEDRFGACYDEFSRPYPLVAALELDNLSTSRLASHSDHLLNLYKDLINGRWQLSADVMKDLKLKLEKRLQTAVASNQETEYLREFRLARAVEIALLKDVPADAERIRTRSIKDGSSDAQIYWILLSAADRHKPTLAFSAALGWVAGPLLAQCRESLDAVHVPAFQAGPDPSAATADVTVPLPSVFPFLTLRLPKGATEASRAAAHVELALVGGSIVMMVCLLCLIFILLMRVSEELNVLQLRTDFLSGVSHDLKTPLTLILLYSDILSSGESLTTEERKKSYQVISREGRRLSHLITNLLHLSRLQKAATDYRMVEGDLAPVIKKTAAVCAEWLGQHGFTVKIDIAANLPPVRFDTERVSQALLNVVDNARKYSGASRSVDIRLWAEGSSVILEIRDYGIGIPPQEKQKVFDQFFRASNAGEQSGSGLGLFLVSDIMQAHGGTVEMESEIGQGTHIRLVFPACETTAEPAKDSAGHQAMAGRA